MNINLNNVYWATLRHKKIKKDNRVSRQAISI